MVKIFLRTGKVRFYTMINFVHLNNKYSCSHYSLCLRGNKLQQLAWELACPHATEYETLASALPEQHYDSIEPRFRGSLTLADAS